MGVQTGGVDNVLFHKVAEAERGGGGGDDVKSEVSFQTKVSPEKKKGET